MSDKPFKDSDGAEAIIAKVIIALVVILFTLFGFFIKQDCDIDKIYLWCRLHPFTIGDGIGCILFYAGCFMLSGIWKKWFTLWNEEHNARWNIITFICTALGAVFIWNL